MLAVVALCSAFAPSHLRATPALTRALQTTLSAASVVNRRAVLTIGAATAATIMAPAAQANYGSDKDKVAPYDLATPNIEGDAAIFTPKAKIDQKGSALCKVGVSMPSTGPLSAGDVSSTMPSTGQQQDPNPRACNYVSLSPSGCCSALHSLADAACNLTRDSTWKRCG